MVRCAVTFGLALLPNVAVADPAAMAAFADHCFRPTMTAERAERVLTPNAARVDFYDLTPFVANNAPSPAKIRPVTPGTDRRCEVSFDGAHVDDAVAAVARGLDAEGIRTEAAVPPGFAAHPGTEYIAARALNPRRLAVVQVGTRPGPNGVETYMNVERLEPRN